MIKTIEKLSFEELIRISLEVDECVIGLRRLGVDIEENNVLVFFIVTIMAMNTVL